MDAQAGGPETESNATPEQIDSALARVLERYARTMVALTEVG